MTARLYVEAVALSHDGDRPFVVRGQTAKALIALVNGGDRGVTALEAATVRLRVSALRRLAAISKDMRVRVLGS